MLFVLAFPRRGRGNVVPPPGSSARGEQLPGVAQALEGVGAAVLQGDAGAGDQVPDGPRDQHLAGAGGGHDAGPDVDGDAADVVAAQVELADVDPGPDVQPDLAQLPAEGQGAADGPAGPVEDGQDAVAGALDQPPPLLGDQPPGQLVVDVQQLPPAAVAELAGPLGRGHDVGEQHRGQQPPGVGGRRELHGVDHDVADAAGEDDLVAVGRLVEVRGLPGRLAGHRLVVLVVEGHAAGPAGHLDPGGGAHRAVDGDPPGPAVEAEQDGAVRAGQGQLGVGDGVLHLQPQQLGAAEVGPQVVDAPGGLDPPAGGRVEGDVRGLPAPAGGAEPGPVLDGDHPAPLPDLGRSALEAGAA